METPRNTTLEQTPIDAPRTQVGYDNVPPDEPPRASVATGEYSDGDSDAPRDIVPMDARQRAETDAELQARVDRGEIGDQPEIDRQFTKIVTGFEQTTGLPPRGALALGEGALTAAEWTNKHGDGGPNQAA